MPSITPVGIEGQLSHPQAELTGFLADTDYRQLPVVGGYKRTVQLPGSLAGLVLQWEDTATIPALPQTKAELIDHVSTWHAGQLARLEATGVQIEPHASFVVDDQSGEDTSLSVVTLTANTYDRPPLYRAEERNPQLPQHQKRAIILLARSIESYLLTALDDKRTSDTTIMAIQNPAQYYIPGAGESEALPRLRQFNHIQATPADAMANLLSLRRWTTLFHTAKC